jgi:hypothetical protein
VAPGARRVRALAPSWGRKPGRALTKADLPDSASGACGRLPMLIEQPHAAEIRAQADIPQSI